MKSRYLEYAIEAARLECEGNYQDAAFAWTCAMTKARNPLNRDWAAARHDFCQTPKYHNQEGKG